MLERPVPTLEVGRGTCWVSMIKSDICTWKRNLVREEILFEYGEKLARDSLERGEHAGVYILKYKLQEAWHHKISPDDCV